MNINEAIMAFWNCHSLKVFLLIVNVCKVCKGLLDAKECGPNLIFLWVSRPTAVKAKEPYWLKERE